MDFTLAHGTANDFVVLSDLDDTVTLSSTLVRALCDRRRGLGADGVIRVGSAAEADAFMDHRNADGSLAEMCGNGVRVVAKHVVDHGLVVPSDEGILRIATRSGVKAVRVVERTPAGTVAAVAVDMGGPVFDPAQVPFEADDAAASKHRVELEGAALEAAGADHLDIAVVSMGNPHAVVGVDDVDAAPVATLGPHLETHRRFPAKANVGFVQVLDPGSIRLRVWERGVGETAACGTGACAAVVALQRLGAVDEEVAVRVPGGTLMITHRAGGTVTMTGPAVEVGRGRLDAAWLEAALRGDMEARP